MVDEISTMRRDIEDIQKALKVHDSCKENVAKDILNLKNELSTKLNYKMDNVVWQEANKELDAAVKTVTDMVSSLRLEIDARHHRTQHDVTLLNDQLRAQQKKVEAIEKRSFDDNGNFKLDAFEHNQVILFTRFEEFQHDILDLVGRTFADASDVQRQGGGRKGQSKGRHKHRSQSGGR